MGCHSHVDSSWLSSKNAAQDSFASSDPSASPRNRDVYYYARPPHGGVRHLSCAEKVDVEDRSGCTVAPHVPRRRSTVSHDGDSESRSESGETCPDLANRDAAEYLPQLRHAYTRLKRTLRLADSGDHLRRSRGRQDAVSLSSSGSSCGDDSGVDEDGDAAVYAACVEDDRAQRATRVSATRRSRHDNKSSNADLTRRSTWRDTSPCPTLFIAHEDSTHRCEVGRRVYLFDYDEQPLCWPLRIPRKPTPLARRMDEDALAMILNAPHR